MNHQSPTLLRKNLFEIDIEFDKIEAIVSDFCSIAQTKNVLKNQSIFTDVVSLQNHLFSVFEMVEILRSMLPIPLYGIGMVEEFELDSSSGGYYLPIQLFKIQKIVENISDLKLFFKKIEHADSFPKLASLTMKVFEDTSLAKLISQKISSEGKILDNASELLKQLRETKKTIYWEIDRTFRSKVQQYQQQNFLAETAESVRNGRRVLAVLSEKKRQVKGIVHDVSESGNISYIEPLEMIEKNNEALNIEKEEYREEINILKNITAEVLKNKKLLDIYIQLLIQLDLFFAKAKFARMLNCSMPNISLNDEIKIENGYHPWLYYLNLSQEKNTVPFSLQMDRQKRLLMLSGPNAGGKSVMLKSVALLIYMNQMGYPVPLENNSSLPILENYFSEIGDNQAIDSELSTYKAKIQKWIYILENITPKSLVLLDELGTGTDPMFGGAMAQAVLEQCLAEKAYIVCTTHLGMLKKWADNHPNILNGAMLFDEKELEPTFKLMIGKPGSSYTFHIAKKTGLKDKIIARAKALAETEQVAYEEMLLKLEKQQHSLYQKQRELEEEDVELKKQIKNWKKVSSELDLLRNKMKYERMLFQSEKEKAKERELLKFSEELKKAEREQLKQAEKEIKEKLAHSDIEIKQVFKKINKIPENQHLEPGMMVKYIQTEAVGLLEKIEKTKGIVVFDSIKTQIPLSDLIALPNWEHKKHLLRKKVIADTYHVPDSIDIRGKFTSEALPEVEKYINDALIQNKLFVKIIHGRGTLRKEVLKALGQIKAISKIAPAEANEGGEGATWIHF